MIENRLINQIRCLDQNTDTLELIESICFNTVVLDLRAENDTYVTHIILDQKMVQKLSGILREWAEGANDEKS
ncbi:hypothetical protein ACWODG_00735 [Enterococcus italicus]